MPPLTEAVGAEINVGRAPVGMIQGIECLEANRQLVLLVVRHGKVLVQGGVEVAKARTMEAATSSISKQASNIHWAVRCGVNNYAWPRVGRLVRTEVYCLRVARQIRTDSSHITPVESAEPAAETGVVATILGLGRFGRSGE